MDSVMLVPIAAIVAWGGKGIYKMYIAHQQEMAFRLGVNPAAMNSDVTNELRQLKEEIARLRDTSTQFDMSIDHHLKQLDERLQHVENCNAGYSTHTEQVPEHQRITTES
jgi:TolA-binding protein